jgi:hypothetical protein
MDPLESVRQYRDQGGPTRTLSVAPPPVLPAQPIADDAATIDVDALDTELAELTPDPTIGTPRGRKRLLQVYLPNSTRQRLDAAKAGHGSLGAAAMAALRGAYEHIITTCVPEPVEAVGPFPAPRPMRRRLHVDDARMRPIYVDPPEAAAIEALAEQCELSVSELVTIAIDWHYGEGRPSP